MKLKVNYDGEVMGRAEASTRKMGDGFFHSIRLSSPFSLGWTEAGIGEPYEHPNPINPLRLRSDLQLSDDFDFRFSYKVLKWRRDKGYLSHGFGGWLILQRPYSIVSRQRTIQSKIIELMFLSSEENCDGWWNVFVRPGMNPHKISCFRQAFSSGWLILQHRLKGDLLNDRFKTLIAEIHSRMEQKLHLKSYRQKLQELFWMRSPVADGIDLTGSVFRFAYLFLEGFYEGVAGRNEATVLHNSFEVIQ